MGDVTWGQVTGVSPLQVRIVGDTTDSTITLKASGLTLSTMDKVSLLRLGSTGGWCVVAKLVAA